MKKLLLISAALLCVAGAAFAGNNSGTTAYLSWSATTNSYDLAFSGATQNNMYVRITRSGGIDFKGGEIDLTWDPASDGLGCFDHVATSFKTSAGTTCTYLNRGTNLPVVTDDSAAHFHVAWANTTPFAGCTAGAIIQIGFEFDGCADPAGCISLNSVILIDSQNVQDVCSLGNGIVTVNGGGAHNCAATPVQATTWGHIKANFNK